MNTEVKLEFIKIKEILSSYAAAKPTRERLKKLQPSLSETELTRGIRETKDARKIIEGTGQPPVAVMEDMAEMLDMACKGSMLQPEQLEQIRQFITACRRMKSYLKKAQISQISMAYYGEEIYALEQLYQEIEICIRGNRIDDMATKELHTIRKKIEEKESEIQTRLQKLLRANKNYVTDSYIATRNGRYVIPVKKEYKNKIEGTVVDASATGTTSFVEPQAVKKLTAEIDILKIEETNEEYRILYTLTDLAAGFQNEIGRNIEIMEGLDFAFAKGKFSIDYNCVSPQINQQRYIKIKAGRHPLLDKETCVPLDFEMPEDLQGVVITGPNTGGKTAALKTIGLFSLMAQSGLDVPCAKMDVCMFNGVFCDIGDGQSITENLSTFSAHIKNIIAILEHADHESLVLLDELGSGTDPAEGMGIAVAVLEKLKEKGILFVATTHYPEVKEYADKTAGLINARMAFDKESLKPLYQLEIGEAGESCALYIAERLGLPQDMLKRAYRETYQREWQGHEKTLSAGQQKTAKRRIQKKKEFKKTNEQLVTFTVGDSVLVYPDQVIGIVYQKVNDRGEVGVQIKREKQMISHKRLKLKASAAELYPEDYDFSIIFDTVEDRKARHQMRRKYQPDIEVRQD